ncbi:hypothetical protein ILUMI_23471 [Ignelater luminosus]|uniref:C2H2-type domain-containing protein n=1 Tax=Ignelater luminosus TaxID=2038154 RepID=A0A8K0CDX1_IGNLU|nr:hypothetical protein ILUMI_23471 [Ignelater luminosus]
MYLKVNFNHSLSEYVYTTSAMEMICNNAEYNSVGLNNSIMDAHSYTKLYDKALSETNYHSSPESHHLIKEESSNRVYNPFFNYNGPSFTFNIPESNSIKKETAAATDSNCYITSLCQTPPSEEGVLKNTKDLKFHCTFCKKSFAKKQQLQNHTKTHTKEKNFKCEICEKSFIHKQQLTNHQKTHVGTKEFKCSFCAKDFMLKQQLQIHEKIHTGEKNFACTMCEKAFITKQQLQNHINSHLGIKPFTCNECHKKFAHKQQLERHTKNHALKQNYTCIECNRKFLTKTSYNEHHTEFHAGQVQSKTLSVDHNVETFCRSPC